jgi:tetratricopeptide (TPR) repeat protein
MRAETLIALNRAQQALDLLANFENDSSLAGEHGLIGQALNARINAYQKLSKPEAALHDLSRFFETSPAHAPQVITPLLSALSRDVQSLIDRDREVEALELATRTLLPVAELLHQWLDTRGNSADVERFALPLAHAYRLTGNHDLAQQWYRRLTPAQADTSDAIIGRAECLFALGGDQHLADAITLYKRIIAAGRTAAGHDHYWLAHLRTLQILDRAKRRTEQIMPQIERLKQEDPTYGGERYRRGFDALRMKYAGNT